MDLALRALIFAVLALGAWAPAGADWAAPGISHSAAHEISASSATGVLCCHPGTDKSACRLPGPHFKSNSLLSRVPDSDPPTYTATPDYRETIGVFEYELYSLHALHLYFPDDHKSIYLTTLRLRL